MGKHGIIWEAVVSRCSCLLLYVGGGLVCHVTYHGACSLPVSCNTAPPKVEMTHSHICGVVLIAWCFP